MHAVICISHAFYMAKVVELKIIYVATIRTAKNATLKQRKDIGRSVKVVAKRKYRTLDAVSQE